MQAYPLEDDLGSEEAQQAALELSDMAAAVETSVAEAMERGRSRRGPDEASWDHSQLDVEQLSAALKDLSNFPVPRPSSAAVLARGRVIVALRTALMAQEWGDVAALLQGVQLEATWDEVQSAAKELEHASVAVIEEVKAALKTGRSLKEYGKATVSSRTIFLSRTIAPHHRPAPSPRTIAPTAPPPPILSPSPRPPAPCLAPSPLASHHRPSPRTGLPGADQPFR